MSQYIPYDKQENIEIPLYGEIERLSWSDRNQTKEQILKKLENYIEVGILEEIPMNTYVRYLTLVNNRITLRFGGFLKKVENNYIRLENRGNSWSVRRCFYHNKEPIFYTRFFINKKYSYLLDRYDPKLNKVKDILIDKLKLDLEKKDIQKEKRENKLVKQRKLLYHIVQDKDKELQTKKQKLKIHKKELKAQEQELIGKEQDLKIQERELKIQGKILLDKEQQIQQKSKELIEKEQQIKEKDKQLIDKEQELKETTKELKKMKSKMKKMKKFIRDGT